MRKARGYAKIGYLSYFEVIVFLVQLLLVLIIWLPIGFLKVLKPLALYLFSY